MQAYDRMVAVMNRLPDFKAPKSLTPARPEPCLCCKQPLEFRRHPSELTPRTNRASDTDRLESWDCVNPHCISNRRKRPAT